MAKTILTVPDISCEHCQLTITKALTPVAGVRSVAVDIPSKQVAVEYDEKVVGVNRLKEVLAEEDYPVDSVASPSSAQDQQTTSTAKDPVCGMEVDLSRARYTAEYDKQPYYFCSQACRQAFLDTPQQYLLASNAAGGCACCKV